MSVAVCLIALALGYRVFVLACSEKDGVKLLGQAIGIFVMIVAVIAMLMSACPKYSKCGKYGSCGSPCSKTAVSKPICPLKS